MKGDYTSFTVKIGVKASLAAIYNAWTQPGNMESWFLQSCQYLDAGGVLLAHDQPVTAGSTYRWYWFLYDTPEEGRITQANGKDFFQFSFAGDCLVDIRLEEKGEDVLVILTHHNIPADEASLFRIRIGCLEGWTFYLTNLKSVYEGGLDLRNRTPALKGLNN